MKYELMSILSPKQTDKEIEKLIKEIKDILTENDFTLGDEDLWGMRDLAYPIRGFNRGYYIVINFTGEPTGMPEVHKDLRILPGLVRYMLTKVPDDYALLRYEGSLMMAKTAKLSSPAEELSKKVRSSRKKTNTQESAPAEEKSAPAPESAPTSKEDLDEKLKAIIEDKDIL